MRKERTLFLTFLKIGAFTFGGGYAMIALLENEFVERKKWIEKDDFLNMVAIAESTPGPVAINSATYIGYKIAGLFGAAAATVAVCIPSFTVIFCISLFFDQFLSLTWVSRAFRGIQVCVIYLISSAGLKMLKTIERNAFNGHFAVGHCCNVGVHCFRRFFFFRLLYSDLRHSRTCDFLPEKSTERKRQ